MADLKLRARSLMERLSEHKDALASLAALAQEMDRWILDAKADPTMDPRALLAMRGILQLFPKGLLLSLAQDPKNREIFAKLEAMANEEPVLREYIEPNY